MLFIFNLIFVVFMAGIITFIRAYRQKKKEHLDEINTIELQHKKELLETQTEIQKETMSYIGREIHDNVGQKLTLSSLYLQQLMFENKFPDMNKSINEVNDVINASLVELRQLSKSLTDDTIAQKTISELIDDECQKVLAFKTFNVSFQNNLDTTLKSYQTKSILLRIVQEFIQNSIKHSKFKNLKIVISNTKRELRLSLEDDGKGFDTKNITSSGIGLKNMKKRIEIINGEFDLKSGSNGTRLTLKLPI